MLFLKLCQCGQFSFISDRSAPKHIMGVQYRFFYPIICSSINALAVSNSDRILFSYVFQFQKSIAVLHLGLCTRVPFLCEEIFTLYNPQLKSVDSNLFVVLLRSEAPCFGSYSCQLTKFFSGLKGRREWVQVLRKNFLFIFFFSMENRAHIWKFKIILSFQRAKMVMEQFCS